jgi:HdeA/HdeB family
MRTAFYVSVIATTIVLFSGTAQAARHLIDYVDANGFLNVQTLTCAQLADTYQEDANMLMAWYSGWYNGLAHKHEMDVVKAKVVEDEVIGYCQANPDQLVIQAISVVIKVDRALLGIQAQ